MRTTIQTTIQINITQRKITIFLLCGITILLFHVATFNHYANLTQHENQIMNCYENYHNNNQANRNNDYDIPELLTLCMIDLDKLRDVKGKIIITNRLIGCSAVLLIPWMVVFIQCIVYLIMRYSMINN